VVSVAGHAAVLGALSQRGEMPQVSELVDASENASDRAARRSEIASIASTAKLTTSRPAIKLKRPTIDDAHNLAEEILFSKSTLATAMKYADLIAISERLLPRSDLRHAYRHDLSADEFVKNRDDILRRFDRYMTTRGITVADDQAIAVLRGYVDFYVGPHKEGQAIATLAALRPGDGGNCVARALNFTAFFYPAYKKYENRNFRFGIMNWTNHVEAVLYNAESDAAVALYPMTILDRKADSQGSPAVVDPREFAAAFLYREKSPRIWKGTAKHLPEKGLHDRSYLEIAPAHLGIGDWVKSGLGDLGRDRLTTSREDLDQNPSPLISAGYADPFTIPETQRTGMNGSWSRRHVSRLAVRDALAAVARNDVRAGLIALKNRTASSKESVLSNTPGFEDPAVTRLSSSETGFISSTRKVSLFPVTFDRGRIRLHVLHRDVPGSRKTPYPTAAEFEDEIVARARVFLQHPKWRQLTSGEIKTFESLVEDIDFATGLIDFANFSYFLYVPVEPNSGLYPFRSELAERFEALGIRNETDAARRAIDRITGTYVADSTGLRLKQYLEAANGAKVGDRIRRFHVLPIVTWASYDMELYNRFTRQIGSLGLKVIEPGSAHEKEAAAAPAKPTLSSRAQETRTKTMTVVILPNRGESRLATPEKLRLDPISSVLYLHYAGYDVSPFDVNDVMKVLSQPKLVAQMTTILEKFFQWMPMIDQPATWENTLADRWILDGDKYCGRVSANREGPDTTRPSLADENSCRLSTTLSSLLRFDEAYLNFTSPSID
jgi:hypothetical protein